MNDDDMKLLRGFADGQMDKQMDKQTDFCDCRVAFATEKLKVNIIVKYYMYSTTRIRGQFLACELLILISVRNYRGDRAD